MLTGEALSVSQPVLAQTDQCSAWQIENNIEKLLTDPALVDTLAACGSDALPFLLRHFKESFTQNSAESEYQRLLILTALGQMGPRASSSTRDLANSMGYRFITSEDMDRAIFYTLWQINGDPTRPLAEILLDAKENELARSSALSELQDFARDNLNLIPGGINPNSLEKTINGALVMIAENPTENLEFRIQAFYALEKKKFIPDVLKEIQNSLDSTLLRVIQDQTKKPEDRLDAVDTLKRFYSYDVLPYAQIIAPVLTQIVLESNNAEKTRSSALNELSTYYSFHTQKIIPGGVNPTSLERAFNIKLVTIAENPRENLDFRIQVFQFLGTERFRPDVLKEIQNSLDSTLLRVIQDQTKKPEDRLDAVETLKNLYSYNASPYALIIVPALTRIVLESNNAEETRSAALSKLSDYDLTLAQKLAENPSEKLDFRVQAFTILGTKRFRPDVLKKIQNSLDSTLLRAIQDQTKKPEYRLDAVHTLMELYSYNAVPHAQIVAQVLTQIILEPSNTEETRSNTLDELSNYGLNLEKTINSALVTIAENPSENLNFRIHAFEFLETNISRLDVLKKIQNSLDSTLLRVIQDQTKKPKDRLDAVYSLESLYSYNAVPHAQIIAPILTRIILEPSNEVYTRFYALDKLRSYDPTLAQEIGQKVSLPLEDGVGSGGAGTPFVRVATVTKLKAAPSFVCRYPLIQTVFAWKCR